jgi:hypothetical protein
MQWRRPLQPVRLLLPPSSLVLALGTFSLSPLGPLPLPLRPRYRRRIGEEETRRVAHTMLRWRRNLLYRLELGGLGISTLSELGRGARAFFLAGGVCVAYASSV